MAETLSFYPGTHDAAESSYTDLDNENRFVGLGIDSKNYCEFRNDQNIPAYTFWPFDVSAIPSDADIVSVGCKVKACVANDNGMLNAYMQLYSGPVAKGQAISYLTKDDTVFDLDVGVWTRRELDSVRLYVYVESSASFGSRRYARLYGAELTVIYTHNQQKFMIKLDGSWHGVSRVFKKISGIWVEQNDLESVIAEGTRFRNGGQISSGGGSPEPDPALIPLTVTGYGASDCCVEIRGIKYTRATTGIYVTEGEEVLCYFGGYEGGSGVSVNGVNVATQVGSSTNAYTWVVPGGVKAITIELSQPGYGLSFVGIKTS